MTFKFKLIDKENLVMSNIEPVAKIKDIKQISYNGYASQYTGKSMSFNTVEAVKLSEVDFDFLSLEMLLFRPTAVADTYIRMKAQQDMPLYVGDIVYNGLSIVSLIEFFIGGRVGVSPGAAVAIFSERSVVNYHSSSLRAALKHNTLWQKADHKTLKQPIEIQTNGGVFGIKG